MLIVKIGVPEVLSLLIQQADVQNMKEAVSSAVDVMQTMASSVCSALSKVRSLFLFGFLIYSLCVYRFSGPLFLVILQSLDFGI